MLLLSWILSIIVGFWVGWFWRDIHHELRLFRSWAKDHVMRHNYEKEPQPQGKVVEPIDDPVAAAKAEFDAEQRRINGQ